MTYAALVDVTGNWLSVVVLLGTIIGGLWRVWRKSLKPYLAEQVKAHEEEAKARKWIFEQMSINGKARIAQTTDLGLRDALDQNTITTKQIDKKLDDHLAAHERGEA